VRRALGRHANDDTIEELHTLVFEEPQRGHPFVLHATDGSGARGKVESVAHAPSIARLGDGGATVELIHPRGVRFDVWLEPTDYAVTTRYNFGKLRFGKRADAQAAATKACKAKKRVNDFQMAIAGDGDVWLMSLFQNEKSKDNWPCGVDLNKPKSGEIMNFDAGDGAFK
jgi:hypothetical protein